MTTSTSDTRAKLAATVVRVTSLWILVGALFKLFAGTPNDLPGPVRDFLPDVDLGLKLHLAIAIELSIVLLAWVAPRIGWFWIAGAFAVFIVILAQTLGDKSCGCFGSKITVPPWVMLAIDSACLLAILATQPWKRARPTRVRWAAVLPLLALCVAAPWLVIDDSKPAGIFPPKSAGGPTVPPEGGVAVRTGEASETAAAPVELPRWIELHPIRQGWVGKALIETDLARWLDVSSYPMDATWILYRLSCTHCRDHFIKLNAEFDPANPKLYVLVKIPEPDEEKFRQVDILPPHVEPEAVLPSGTEWSIQTPWTLEIEGGVVKRAFLNEGEEEDSAKQQ